MSPRGPNRRRLLHQSTHVTVAKLYGLEGAPRALPSNYLRLVHADHRLGEGIGIALAANRRRDAGVHEAIRVPHREILGEFNWSSQHLDDEVLRWRNGNGDGQTEQVGLRCVRPVARESRGGRSNNGSGRRSPGGCRVRRPLCHVACLRPWVVVGSVRAVGCRRSAWRRRRLVTCALRRGRRSQSYARRTPGCATLPVGFVEPRRLSHENCVATLRLEAAVWSIGRRLRSGTATDVPSGRR